jgi:hypothetical protein
VGFGEAGAEVIADNIRSGGDLNPMVPGRKVAAIFGFCDIRSFTGGLGGGWRGASCPDLQHWSHILCRTALLCAVYCPGGPWQ